MKRFAIAAAGGILGAVIGGGLGSVWYSVYGSDADPLGGIAAALAGGVAGAMALASLGWSFARWRSVPPSRRVLALIGWIVCGTLLVVGIVYIGGWTDSDGPSPEATVGILGIPVSFLGSWLISRSLQRQGE